MIGTPVLPQGLLYVIIAHHEGRRWISGVFVLETDTLRYLQTIPDAERSGHEIQVVRQKFPLFVLEDETGFRFFGEEEIAGAIAAYRRAEHWDEDQYAILFRFTEGYRPNVAGADEMGAVWHIHIADEELRLSDFQLSARLR